MKIPDPKTSPSLISLNGFCGRKTTCFLSSERRDRQARQVLEFHVLSTAQVTSRGTNTVSKHTLKILLYVGETQVTRLQVVLSGSHVDSVLCM